MAQIFISYSRVDLAFTKQLYDRLVGMRPGVRVWYDQAPHGLVGGNNWWKTILDAIAESDIFIYVLSNESVQSRYCQAEFEEARRLQKRIITIQARDRTRLKGELADIHYIDMKHGVDDADALVQLSRAVDEHLRAAKKRRPLWKGRTPRPADDPIPERSPGEEDVKTPDLVMPSRSDRKPAPGPRIPWWTWAAAALVIVGALGALFLVLNGDTPDTAAPAVAENVPPVTDTFTAEEIAQTPVARSADWAPYAPVARDFALPDGGTVTMVLVPAGSFAMGSTEEEIAFGFEMCQQAADNDAECQRSWFEDEVPNGDNTQVFAEPYWIDKHEVTNEMFASFLNAVGNESAAGLEYLDADDSDARIERSGSVWRAMEGYENHPVTEVSWFGGHDYCEWRDAHLPTEAEWEYAARGPDRGLFPWGDEFEGTLANHCDRNCGEAEWAADYNYVNEENDDGYTVTAPVGSYPDGASWVGALDMSGNVWEWTSSLYELYPYDAEHGRERDTGDSTDVLRVLRGGSFLNSSSFLRAANRDRDLPDITGSNRGLRCARSYE